MREVARRSRTFAVNLARVRPFMSQMLMPWVMGLPARRLASWYTTICIHSRHCTWAWRNVFMPISWRMVSQGTTAV